MAIATGGMALGAMVVKGGLKSSMVFGHTAGLKGGEITLLGVV
jgi:hypothetical protein